MKIESGTTSATRPQPIANTNRQWFQRAVIRLAEALAAVIAAATLLAFAARWHWMCELFSHFPVQMAIGGTGSLVILVALRRWKTAILPVLVVAINAGYCLPLFLPAEQSPCVGSTYRAICANLYRDNRDRTRFIEFVRTSKPDFFVFMEIDDSWWARLHELDAEYPYSVVQPRSDNFGIALFSRLPIESHRVENLGNSGVPSLVATIALEGRRLTLVATHPLPPVGQDYAAHRNRQLQAVGKLAAQLPRPLMVLGDLNTTSWSPHFRDFIAQSKLRDSRRGFAIQPTWPRLPGLLRIPIDHILVSRETNVIDRKIGPDIGSDHRPVVMDFCIGR